MKEELFFQIVSLLITLIAAIITGILIPYIKSKLTASQMAQVTKYTEMAVRCAEQMYTTEEWAKKKLYVEQYITGIIRGTFKLDITEEDINVLIEGCVNKVKKYENK